MARVLESARRGDEEIRFEVSADHTEAYIDEVLAVLARFPEGAN